MAQKVTSTDRNKRKPNKDLGWVAAGKRLAEYNRRVRQVKKEKGGTKQSEDLRDPSPRWASAKGTRLKPEAEQEPSSFILTQILSVASDVLFMTVL